MEKSQMDEEEFSKHVNDKNYTRVYNEKKNEAEQNKTTTRTAAFDLEQVLHTPRPAHSIIQGAFKIIT